MGIEKQRRITLPLWIRDHGGLKPGTCQAVMSKQVCSITYLSNQRHRKEKHNNKKYTRSRPCPSYLFLKKKTTIPTTSPRAKVFNENEFHCRKNERLGGKHFHMRGFALRLVLIPKQKATRKWHIDFQYWSWFDFTGLTSPRSSPPRFCWPERKWNFTVSDRLSSAKRERYQIFFFDFHNITPCRFIKMKIGRLQELP